jgi:hypothetical protein
MRLKGILQPSHKEPPPAVGTNKEKHFRPGRRYPISLRAAYNLEAKLSSYLKKGEGIDLSRMTRFVSENSWVVWTTEGRKVEVEVDPQGMISEVMIGEEADPEIPERAR